MNRGSRSGSAEIKAREEVACGLTCLGQPHLWGMTEDVAATDATDAGPKGPCAAMLSDAKREAGNEAVGVVPDRQSRDRNSAELPGFHGGGPRFWAQFGRTRLTIYGNPAQHRAMPFLLFSRG